MGRQDEPDKTGWILNNERLLMNEKKKNFANAPGTCRQEAQDNIVMSKPNLVKKEKNHVKKHGDGATTITRCISRCRLPQLSSLAWLRPIWSDILTLTTPTH